MRKSKLRFILPLFLAIVLLTATLSSASIGFYFDYKPTFSITNIAYLVDSSVSGYAQSIEDAFSTWKEKTKNNDVNARVGYYKVSSSPYYTPPAQVVFTLSTTGTSYTAYFTATGAPANSGTGEPYSNWAKCVIYLAPNLSDPKATVIHELGHVFSLKHPFENPEGVYKMQTSCMIPSIAPSTYIKYRSTVPTAFDVANVNSRFK
jgi:hypothetical protein